jgi:hypothetical protein
MSELLAMPIPTIPTRPCAVCGAAMACDWPRNHARRYCSPACYKAGRGQADAQKRRERDAARRVGRPTYSRVCVICGKTFESQHPRRTTCGEECGRVAKRRSDTKGRGGGVNRAFKCTDCGGTFSVSHGTAGRLPSMCQGCKTRREEPIRKTCETCGEGFSVAASKAYRTTCEKCLRKMACERRKTCLVCGAEFVDKSFGHKAKFCGGDCKRAAASRPAGSTRAAKRKSPAPCSHALPASDWECDDCGSGFRGEKPYLCDKCGCRRFSAVGASRTPADAFDQVSAAVRRIMAEAQAVAESLENFEHAHREGILRGIIKVRDGAGACLVLMTEAENPDEIDAELTEGMAVAARNRVNMENCI